MTLIGDASLARSRGPPNLRAASALLGSASPSELLFDLAVGGRLRRKLAEGCGEEAVGVLVAALAAADRGEVRDYLPLVFLVAELPQEDERLLELLNRHRDAAGMNESKSQVVARQRLGPPVTELMHDLERGHVLLGRLFALALASKLRPELVEPARLAVPVGRGWFPPASLDDGAGPMGRDVRDPAPVLVEVELTEPRLDRA